MKLYESQKRISCKVNNHEFLSNILEINGLYIVK